MTPQREKPPGRSRRGSAARKGRHAPASPRGARAPRRAFRLASIRGLDRALLAILLVAGLLRLWGIADRLPDASLRINIIDDTSIEETDRTTILRAWGMWRGGVKDFDLNPHTGGWPALTFYATLGIQIAYKAWYGFIHPGTPTAEFADFVQRDAAGLFLLARLLNALIGVLSVALTWRLALPLAGRAGAILASLFVATNPFHVLTSQHISDPNLFALVFVALAASSMARVAEGGGTRDSIWCGIWIGLAGACKYVPLILIVPLALAHMRGARWRGFAMAVGAALVAMFATSPFTFLDWKTTTDAFTIQRKSLLSPWVGQSPFPISLPTYLIESLPRVLGWPAYLLSILGLVLLWRRGAAGRTMTLIAVVILLANGMLRAAQERYVLVIVPILFLGAAVAITAAVEWWRGRSPGALGAGAVRGGALAAGALAALSIAWPLPELWSVRRALALPDSRHEARRWVNANIGTTRRVGLELYGPVFRERERNVCIWPFFATQAPLVGTAYRPEFLDGLEFFVTSGEISRRFALDSLSYPREAAFYRWLREHGEVLWKSDGVRFAGPIIEVLALPASLSTRARRDSLFGALEPKPRGVYRLALWCHDMSVLFSRAAMDDRAEEWALRGLQTGAAMLRPRLCAALALARINLGHYADAEEAARTGIKADSTAYALHLYRGLALERMGRLEEALPEIQAALQGSGDPRLYADVGQILASLGRYDEAVDALSRVPPGARERAPARRDMAVLLLNKLHRVDEGIAALRDAAAATADPGEAALLRDEAARWEKGR